MKRLLSVILAMSMATAGLAQLPKKLKELEEKFSHHVGFVLYHPAKKKTLVEYNPHSYFTPASNTKVFTFFAGLSLLGDSLPALKYLERNDSLIFWGLGDPSFLNSKVYTNSKTFEFLKSQAKRLYFSGDNFFTTHLGPGWGWDDYKDSYSAERCSFPIYGNLFTIIAPDKIYPSYFTQFIKTDNRSEPGRKVDSNETIYTPHQSRITEVPIHFSKQLTVDLLSDTLDRSVRLVSKTLSPEAKVLRSIPADSVYKVMMQESDNFLAEHILLMCSGLLSDSLSPEVAIRHVREKLLADTPDSLQWVDGSGLSRYNLFTPASVVHVWQKIYAMKTEEQLFPLLATGGKNGTIKNWYKSEKPFVFGKTGTLANNHSLSGYLVTKKGTVLIFAFMNSNFVRPTNDLRKEMQNILFYIYSKY